MNIFMTGATGFIGRILSRRLMTEGHRVTILTRAIRKGAVLPEGIFFFEGNPTKPGPWQEELLRHEVIINLVGATVFRLWSRKGKKEIMESRILATRNIIEALEGRRGKVLQLLNASAVGYYGFHRDEILDETAPSGNDFLAQVVSKWESEARCAEKFGVRVICCRFGLVLARNEGVLSKMVLPYKFYLGSQFGNGKQWLSWVHEQDLSNIMIFLLSLKNIEGPVNCTAPFPVPNRDLTYALGKVLKKPLFIFPVPGFILRLGLGEFSNFLLQGQRVIPKILEGHGFCFKFPTINEALNDLFG
ncbi:MAG: TIGR01777 family oxidoreductase [Candidatus Aminicenantaceae bacterium]